MWEEALAREERTKVAGRRENKEGARRNLFHLFGCDSGTTTPLYARIIIYIFTAVKGNCLLF